MTHFGFLSDENIHKRCSRSWPVVQYFSHSTSSVKKFFSAVRPFNFVCSKNFCSCSTIHGIHFEWLVYPFLIRSLAVRSAIQMDTIWNVFAWGHILFQLLSEYWLMYKILYQPRLLCRDDWFECSKIFRLPFPYEMNQWKIIKLILRGSFLTLDNV